jgi:hypothetical protein
MDRRGTVSTSKAGFETGFGAITAPAVAPNGNSIVGSEVGQVVAVKPFLFAATEARWQYDTGAAITAKPAVADDGSVYVGNEDGDFYALNSDGSLRWQTSVGSPVLSSAAVDADRVYLSAGTRLYALNIATGDELWSLDLDGDLDEGSGPVIGAGRTLYVTRADSTLVAVRETDWLLPPSDLLATVGAGSLVVQWRDNSTGESGFGVQVCGVSGPCFAAGQTLEDDTQLTVQQVPVAEPLFVRVQALGLQTTTVTAGVSQAPAATASSDFVTSDVVYALPGAPLDSPVGLAAEAQSSTAISLTWSYAGNDRELLLGFQIYRAQNSGGPYALVGSAGASANGFLDTDLTPGTTYFYRVTAQTESDESDPAGPVNATTKVVTLARPTDLVIQTDEEQEPIVLNWLDNADDEGGYAVERRPEGVADYELLDLLPADSDRYTDTMALADGAFDYRVKAVAAQAESGYISGQAIYRTEREHPVFLPLVVSDPQ